MQRIIAKYLCIVMFVAMLFTVAVNYSILNDEVHDRTVENAKSKSRQIAQMLEQNEQELTMLEHELEDEYVTRCKTFAFLIKQNPGLLKNQKELEEVKVLLDVDELLVTDQNGIVQCSTVPVYRGLDLRASEETSEFLKILTEDADSVIQNAKMANGGRKLLQYFGVERQDADGIVVIGMNRSHYTEEKTKNEVQYIFRRITTSQQEVVYAVDASTNIVLAHTYENYVGQNVLQKGFPENYIEKAENGAVLVYDGGEAFHVVGQYGDIIIGVGTDQSKMRSEVTERMIIVVIYFVIIWAAVAFLIQLLVKRKIIDGVHKIINDLHEVEDGDTKEIACESDILEFQKLEDGINRMVKGVTSNSNKIAHIMDKMDMPIAAYEYSDKFRHVWATDKIADVLSLTAEELEELLEERHEFVKKLEKLKARPEEEEAVYKISEIPEKWIQIDEQREEDKVFGVVQDVTTHMLKKYSLMKERDYDALTGLQNRRSFEKDVCTLLEQGDVGNVAMVMFDVDNFKQINDSYGHDFGDEYLKQFANTLADCAKENMITGRRSGDEFYAFLYQCKNIEQVCKRMNQFYDSLANAPLVLPNGKQKVVSASGGIAFCAEGKTDYATLLAMADEVLYRAKERQKGGYFTQVIG